MSHLDGSANRKSMAALAQSSAWSQRESDLLTVTLQLLQHHGYERLTLDAVATSARASKATIYRRWGSKAELVLAALVQGAEHNAKAPDTGTLRGDLLQLGKAMCEHARKQASTIRAVLMELSRNPALADVMQRQFLGERAGSINHILRQAVERGEIKKDSIDTELWDLLPGYLIFRSVVSRRRPTQRTVRALVDDVIIPGLSRPTQYRLPNLEAGGDE